MSKPFLIALVLIFAAFAGYEVWLNLHLRMVNNTVVSACLQPAVQMREVYYLSAEDVRRPMNRGVMTR